MSELELPGVTQASVAKKYGFSTSQVSRLSKKEDLVRDFESGAIVAENEKEKARRRMLGMLCFYVSNRNCRPRCVSFRVALEAESL